MIRAIFTARFDANIGDDDAMRRSFVEWNERVRRDADPKRLVVWRATDGWPPLCDALGVRVPDEPFPVTNTTEEWRQRTAQPTE
jgi:hypothetical protein